MNINPSINLNTLSKVEDVKRPLKKGELFLVSCIYKELFNDGLYIIPVINHPHNDIENGQKEIHYHMDTRFVRFRFDKYIIIDNTNECNSKHKFGRNIRPILGVDGQFGWFILPVINEEFIFSTKLSFIKDSNLKHKCIHKGKCPHRGMDLSQIEPINGEITCPLHGLVFDAVNKKLKTNLQSLK